MALKNLGHEIIGACEIDKHARQIYGNHFPDVPIHPDATKINPNDLPDFDLLVAGFPCQPFSVAGVKRGFEDTRGTLFFEIARITQEKRPRYLLLENVKGILSHDGGETGRKIIRTLDELGYDVQAGIVNTKNFLPQNRERAFFVGTLRGDPRPQIFPLKREDSETSPRAEVTPTKITPVLTPERIPRRLNGRRFKEEGDEAFTLTTLDRHGIMIKKISNCIRVGGRGSLDRHTWDVINDGVRIRLITPIECERLQGFPDNWTESVSERQRYICLGNAVSVPVVQNIISKLLE